MNSSDIDFFFGDTYDVTLKLTGCKLTSGVAFADVSDATEFTEDREDRTSDTGATPKEDNISSKSLENEINTINSVFRSMQKMHVSKINRHALFSFECLVFNQMGREEQK